MSYHHYAKSHVAARLGNWGVGVFGACAVIAGVYALVFHYSRVFAMMFLSWSLISAIIVLIGASKARRNPDVPARARRAYMTAVWAALVAIISVVVVVLPITAHYSAYIGTAAVQLILAFIASRQWVHAESAVLGRD
ncbi:MAG: hypothetical protein E7A62_02660 [Actinomycetaceae bacterium]|nr:hypothetical protein [Actinomycetaceae bacterium]MDU0969882.1 hypothetical protein [Actinomycetaceae bacterium]